MLPDTRIRPARTPLERIMRPAPAVIFPCIQLPAFLAMNLGHGIQHQLHMLLLAQRRGPVHLRIAGQDGRLACSVDVVARVADGPDAGDVGGGGAAADDGVFIVLPEAGGILERDLAGGGVAEVVDGVGDGGGESLGETPAADDGEGG